MRIILFMVFCSGCSVHSEFTIKGEFNQTGDIENKRAEACYHVVMKR